MFVYALAQPIDSFDGPIPPPGGSPKTRQQHRLGATRDARPGRDARRGRLDGRHAPPSLHRRPSGPGTTELLMVVKQDTAAPASSSATARWTGCWSTAAAMPMPATGTSRMGTHHST